MNKNEETRKKQWVDPELSIQNISNTDGGGYWGGGIESMWYGS